MAAVPCFCYLAGIRWFEGKKQPVVKMYIVGKRKQTYLNKIYKKGIDILSVIVYYKDTSYNVI